MPTIYPLARLVFAPLPELLFTAGPQVELQPADLAVQFALPPLMQFDFRPYDLEIVPVDTFRILTSDGVELTSDGEAVTW